MNQAGNMAETASRVVQVIVDDTPPQIILNGNPEDTVTFGAVYEDPGVAAFDKVSKLQTQFLQTWMNLVIF